MWQKHVDLAIDAVRLAAGRSPGIRLIVAGAVDVKSEPYLADLERHARGAPVTFERDPTDDRLAELYRSSTALVFTPRNEDWGMVPLEAMASGLPVLAIDAGGPRESILDGRTGWLLPDDAIAFADRMVEVAAMTADHLAPLRSAARSRAAEFAWEPFVARLDDVLEAVASGRRP
jgi:glycosyltransferase involved in cell wall biosynthesis